VNERKSDHWEKGFDLKSLPDVELLDAQESAPVPAASPPAPEQAEPETLPEPVGDDDIEQASAQGQERQPEPEQSEPRATPLPEREIDPRVDPFAGWVSGHPLAEGQSRRERAEEGPAAPALATVAVGEDPFAGRFAPVAQTAAEPTMSDEGSDAEAVEVEAAAETEEVPVDVATAPVENAQVMLADTGGAPAASAGQSSAARGALPVGTAAAATDQPPETSRPAHLAKVVPITSGRSKPLPEGDVQTPGGEGSDARAMQEFLAGLSDEELDRAVELFERQVRQLGGADGRKGHGDSPAHVLDPLSEVLGAAVGEVELVYRIEEIEGIIDARLPDAARRDANWWSNRAGRLELGYAAAWVSTGWWSYPDLDAGRVRFRRPV
jgi:hypothetical protein